MSRRASLPGAAELFRATGPVDDVPPAGAATSRPCPSPVERDVATVADARRRCSRPSRRASGRAPDRPPPRPARTTADPSGRERHDEKITVYVSADELIDLEQARLVLRGEHGLAVDRGRIVREAARRSSSPTSRRRARPAPSCAGCARAEPAPARLG